MHNLLSVIPYIGLALLWPSLAHELRLLGLLLLGGCLLWRWAGAVMHPYPAYQALFGFAGLAITLLLCALLPGEGRYHQYIISLAGGVFFWFSVPEKAEHRLVGVIATALALVGLASLAVWDAGWIPLANLAQKANQIFTLPTPADSLSPPLPEAIAFPPDYRLAMLINQAAILVMGAVLLVPAYLPAGLGRGLGSILPLAVGALLVKFYGPLAAGWCFLATLLFVVTCPFPAASSKIRWLYLVLSGILFTLLTVDPWNPVYLFSPLAEYEWFWQATHWFPIWPKETIAAIPSASSFSAFCLLLLLAALIAAAERKSWWTRQTRPEKALGILLIATLAGAMQAKVWPVVCHPLFWLACGALMQPARWQHAESLEPRIEQGLRFVPIVKVAAVLVLSLAAFLSLWDRWSADDRLAHSFELDANGRLALYQQLYRDHPNRGDVATLYATEALQTAIRENRLPGDNPLLSFEVALRTSAGDGIAPLLAISRLSDIYLVQADSQSALRILRDAIEAFPGIMVLRELYADLLDTVGQRQQALEQYRLCLNHTPTSVRLRKKMSLIAQSLGQTRDQRIIEESLSILDPTFQ